MHEENDPSLFSQLPQEEVVTYLMQIIEHLPGFVYWKNKDSRYMGCNSNLAKVTGLDSVSDIIGKLDKDLPWGIWQAEEFAKIDQEVMRTGQKNFSINKIPIKTHDGHYLYVKTEKVPLRNNNGEVIGILGMATDITDEKVLEQALLKQKQENIIANMPGYVYWKNVNSEYMGCNDNVAKLSGLRDRSEIVGKTDYDFYWGEGQAADFIKDDQEVMRNKINKITEHIFHKPSGGYFYLRTEKRPLYEGGKIMGVLAVAINITELKDTQERLKQAQGRLDGMALLSFSIAHELRTPLSTVKTTATALKGYLPILIKAYENYREHNQSVSYITDNTLDLIKGSFDTIIKSVKSSNQIINMILTNLAAEEGHISKYSLCSIYDCVKTSIDEYTYPLGNKNNVDISKLQDFQFMGEGNLIKHVFFNLFKNAFYFIEKVGKGKIYIWSDSTADYNQVYFKDTGSGILKGKLDKIFDRFYTSDTHHGTGIGLAFCKLVMEAIGGKIACESEFGEYTQFILTFPKINGEGV